MFRHGLFPSLRAQRSHPCGPPPSLRASLAMTKLVKSRQRPFKRTGKTDRYTIIPDFGHALATKLQVKAHGQAISSVKLNGTNISWKSVSTAVGLPVIEVNIPANTVKKIGLEIAKDQRMGKLDGEEEMKVLEEMALSRLND